jgi:hypothetical protein
VTLELNEIYQLLVCADDVSLLVGDIDTTKKDTETLIHDNEDIDLEVNSEKTEYMLLSRHQNADQNHNMNIANRSLEMCCSSNICEQQ